MYSPAVASVPQAGILEDVEQMVPTFPKESAVRIERKGRVGRDEMEVRRVRILGSDPGDFRSRSLPASALGRDGRRRRQQGSARVDFAEVARHYANPLHFRLGVLRRLAAHHTLTRPAAAAPCLPRGGTVVRDLPAPSLEAAPYSEPAPSPSCCVLLLGGLKLSFMLYLMMML